MCLLINVWLKRSDDFPDQTRVYWRFHEPVIHLGAVTGERILLCWQSISTTSQQSIATTPQQQIAQKNRSYFSLVYGTAKTHKRMIIYKNIPLLSNKIPSDVCTNLGAQKPCLYRDAPNPLLPLSRFCFYYDSEQATLVESFYASASGILEQIPPKHQIGSSATNKHSTYIT